MVLRAVSEMLRRHFKYYMFWVAALGKNAVKFFGLSRFRQVKTDKVM